MNNASRNDAMALVAAVLAIAICMLCAGIDVASAQGAFGIGHAAHFASPDESGVFGWVLAKQAAYYRDFSGMIRAAKANGTAVYGLLLILFIIYMPKGILGTLLERRAHRTPSLPPPERGRVGEGVKA